jgi:tetratricopeptide (TPR) repeat protein
VELIALYALATQLVAPESAAAKDVSDWLMAHRMGNRWNPDKATGPATLALAKWFGKNRLGDQRYRLTVSVNETEVANLDLSPEAQTQSIEVPATAIKEGKQRIEFRLTGRGQFAYQCNFGGMVPADKLVSTSKEWRVQRFYEPGPLEEEGQPVARGFSILQGEYTTFRNPLTQLPVAKRAHVMLVVSPNVQFKTSEVDQHSYLVVSEPIPAGAVVAEGSVKGAFERYEITPGRIIFYLANQWGWIEYDLHGYLPGDYRMGPSVVRNAYDPNEVVATRPAALAVLPLGAKSQDEYRLTPDELLALGRSAFGRHDFDVARDHLSKLLSEWNLSPDPYREAAKMLLDVHLEKGPPDQIVRYFEIIKQRWPDLEVPFADILKVGQAYHDMGEYERSFLVYRATVEGGFEQESAVAGFLDAQGEFLRSVDVMGRLLREYPPEPYVAQAMFALSQRVYAKAPAAAEDPRLREKKVNRVDLIQQALAMLARFRAENPDDPAADQAAFSAVNALLELRQYVQASAMCRRAEMLYPKSTYLDSFWYIIGYCHFALGEHDQAIEMCRKVAETKIVDPQTGRETESQNKWRAVYILGQVYHSLNRAADAIREYTRVEDRFADAKEAIAYFLRKDISLDEVTTFKPGQAVDLDLKFRNIPKCELWVYRIDLMKFSLLNRNLAGISQINLSGIRPLFETGVELGDGKDYRDRTKSVSLPLSEEGAYLVVCRGENLHTSGLVLISPLALEVQEDAVSGRVRATVRDVVKEQYVYDVHTKAIGSRNEDFVSGETDLRGVFVADGIQGTATVIAQADDGRYAFFRGKTELQPAPPTPAANEPGQQQAGAAGKSFGYGKDGLEKELLKDVMTTNSFMQGENSRQLQQLYDKNNRGIKAEAAY